MRTIVLKTEKATRGLAVRLAARILQTSIQLRQARIVGLTGDLGTGKTTFIKAFVKMFHVKQKPGQGLGQFGFSHSRRADKQKRPHRTVGITQTGTGTTDAGGN